MMSRKSGGMVDWRGIRPRLWACGMAPSIPTSRLGCSSRLWACGMALGAILGALSLAGCGENILQDTNDTEVPAYESAHDEFTQAAVARRDILWMIDNTHSMSDETAALAPQFNTFINAIAPGISYQVGIVTTDFDHEGGALWGAPWIITRDTPDAEQAFSDNVSTLVDFRRDDAPEKGLDSIRAALSPAMLAAGARNYGFLRPDAGLSIIVVSDSDDKSTGTLAEYEQALIDLKGGKSADLITFSAIVGPDPGTNGENGCSGASYGERYMEVAGVFAGDIESICDDDISDIITRLGQEQVQRQTRFRLAHIPVDGTLVVRVNNELITKDEAWTYDSSTGELVFKDGHVPDFGAYILAIYQYDPEESLAP